MKQFLSFIGFLGIVACCQSAITTQLDRADSLMEEHPDSALAIVSGIDARQIILEREKARYALVTSIALDKNYIDTPDDSLINIAVKYYSRHGKPTERMKAWYYHGLVKKNAREYTSAVVSFEKAERLADALGDLRYIGLINRNKANIFNATNNLESSIEYSEKALKAFENNLDTVYADHMKYTLAISYLNNRNYKEARTLLRNIIDQVDATSQPFLVTKSKLGYARALVSSNDSLDVAIDIFRKEQKNAFTYFDFGYYAYGMVRMGQRDSAKYWGAKACEIARNPLSLATLDPLMARIDAFNGDYPKAYQRVSNALSVQDSLTRILLQQSLSNIQREYFRQEVKSQEQLIQKQRIIYFTCSAILLLLMAIAAMFIWERTKQKETRLKEQMANLAIMQKNAQVDKRSLVGFWFLEKLARLCGLSDKYYTSENLLEKEEALRQFKKGVQELKHSEQWFSELEANLNKYCFGIMEKLETQVPQIKGENRTIIALFFADIPDAIIQLLMGRLSPGSIRTLRSRLRKEIKDYNPPDKDLFLDMLAKKTA